MGKFKKVLVADILALYLLWHYRTTVSQKIVGFDVFNLSFWQALQVEFYRGTLRVQSLYDWLAILFPVIYLLFSIWVLCIIPKLSLTGIKNFLHRLFRRFWRRCIARPRLILRRHRLQKPRSIYAPVIAVATPRQQPKMKQDLPAPKQPSDIPAQPKKTEPQPVQTKESTPQNTPAGKKGDIAAVAEIKELLNAYHFKPFTNLSIAGLSLPISGAKGNVALLFLFLNRPNAEWVIEENEDITQGSWFSDTSFIPSPCQTLQKVKHALLKQEAGLNVYCFIVLAQGTILGQQSLWDKFQKAGFTFVCARDNIASGFTPIADFFKQHFTKD